MKLWRKALLGAGLILQTLSAQSPSPAGKLIVAGGGISSARREIWGAIQEHGLPGKPIGIISTGSDNPLETSTQTAKRFESLLGEGSAVAIPLGDPAHPVDDPALLALIRSCGGFFFSGGSQIQTSRTLLDARGKPTPALLAIREVHGRGGVVAGSSAGAAIMSDPMISGGNSAEALRRGATPFGTPVAELGVEFMPGLGFHPEVLYDQHHLERGRFGRLLAAMSSKDFPQKIGIGIAENTAWVYDPARGIGSVIGAKNVLVLDNSVLRKGRDGAFSGMRLHVLGAGDAIHLPSGQIRAAEGKQQGVSMEAGEPLYQGELWAQDALWHLVQDLAKQGPRGAVSASDDTFRLRLERSGLTQLWHRPGDPPDTRPRLTLTHLHVILEKK